MSGIDSFMNLSPLKTTVSREVILFSDISAVNFILVRKSKYRLHGLPMYFFFGCVALSKPSNCNFALISMSFRSLALSRTLLLQQLQWLQQDRRFRLYTRVSSAVV